MVYKHHCGAEGGGDETVPLESDLRDRGNRRGWSDSHQVESAL